MCAYIFREIKLLYRHAQISLPLFVWPPPPFFVMYVYYSDVWLLFLVVVQRYETDVAKEYVIRGNDALMKCSIPSFVADVVQIIAWLDSDERTVHLHQQR